MRKVHFLFIIFLIGAKPYLFAQQKVGIALSGGGAKGLAHIGVLKALDEYNVEVSYISGTSMGAIIGGLYAMGYSGQEIEKIAKNEDWERLMSNYIPMSDISIEEKDEYQRYVAEFPIVDWKLKLPASVLRGQKLENRLIELTIPAYDIYDFDSLPIPFHCLATDIVTGKPVVLKSGSLGRAMRASMGMPTLFRPIYYNEKLLIDGGLVKNFPVDEVQNMGADFVIGSYVGTDLYSEKELQSFDKVILQIGNFNDFYDVAKQKENCSILIQPQVEGFSTMSFDQIDSLIDIGYKSAISVLKMNSFDFKKIKKANKLTFDGSITIDTVFFEGVNKVDLKLLIGELDIVSGDEVSIKDIEDGTARIYGTRNFEKVSYRVEKKNNVNQLIVEVIERENVFFKFGLNYTNEIGAALKVNTTLRNVIGNRSRTLVSINIAENPRLKLDYFKYLGPKQKLGFRFTGALDYIKIPLYQNDQTISIDRYAFLKGGVTVQSSFSRTIALSTGFEVENVTIKPTDDYLDLVTSQSFSSFKNYLRYEINTLQRRAFPEKGLFLDLKYIFSFSAVSDFYRLDDDLEESLDSKYIDSYSQLQLDFKWNIKLSDKISLIQTSNLGLTFSEDILYSDNFFIGGLPTTLKNTISFPGMRLYDQIKPNFVSVTSGVQVNLYKNLFFVGKGGAIFFGETHDFFTDIEGVTNSNQYEFGAMIGLGYRSLIGPIYAGYARSSALDFGLFNLSVGYNF